MMEEHGREPSPRYGDVADAIFCIAIEPGGRFRFVSVNRAFLAALGATEAEVVGKLAEEVIPEASRSLVLGHYQTACLERRTVRWEEEAALGVGTKVGEVSVSPVLDASGACTHLLGTVHDVTERRNAEDLRIRLASIVEFSDDAIITKTLEGIVTTWNRGAERMFGYPADEVLGKSIALLIPEDRLDEEPTILAALRRGEHIEHYETVRRRKDGTLLDVSVTVSPLRDATNRIIGASKIARDVTRRKLAEAAVLDETRVLDVLNRTGALISSRLDLQGVVQAVTDAATELAGAKFGAFFYNVVNAQGEAFLLYALSGAQREAFEKLGLPRNTPIFNTTFRGEGVVRSADITQDPRYGTMAPHHGMPRGHLPVRSYLAVPVILRSGEVVGGLFFGHPEVGVFTERSERLVRGVSLQAAIAIDNARLYDDVKRASDERKQLLDAERAARAEAERVSTMKDEFLATLSHELRTPLNAILGWSELLHAGDMSDSERREGIAVIERNARAQTRLIEDLLDMSRIISGKIRLDVQRVELEDVVRAAIASVRHAATTRDIRLQVILDPLAGPVRGDPERLQQCLWNLLSNAIKFTPKGGKIQITLERVNSHVEIGVTDSGQGIEPAFLPHVFERFRQADGSLTRRHGGLGLGLSIVKNLVELHGGSVRVASAGLGQGATFTVELPLLSMQPVEVEPAREARRVGRPSPDHPSLADITVLVVDDEADARNLVRVVLEGCGARVLLAASAREGWEVLLREKPDMIVSDIGMPDEDGYEFMRKVRQLSREAGGQTPAAALTAMARAEDRTRALRAGYQTHVAKPVEPTELTAVVASLAFRR